MLDKRKGAAVLFSNGSAWSVILSSAEKAFSFSLPALVCFVLTRRVAAVMAMMHAMTKAWAAKMRSAA